MAYRTVALVGMSKVTRERANFEPPEVEIWGLTWDFTFLKRLDRYFEVHSYEGNNVFADPERAKFLETCDIPVYQLVPDPRIPTAVQYPITEVGERFRDYWKSSMCYMLALAAYEGVDEIHLWGVDCANGTEYEAERPCVEYWLGVCEGLGIKVQIPDSSPLRKCPNGAYGIYGSQSVTPRYIMDRVAQNQIDIKQTRVQYETAGSKKEKREAEEQYIAQMGAQQLGIHLLEVADPRLKGKVIEVTPVEDTVALWKGRDGVSA